MGVETAGVNTACSLDLCFPDIMTSLAEYFLLKVKSSLTQSQTVSRMLSREVQTAIGIHMALAGWVGGRYTPLRMSYDMN